MRRIFDEEIEELHRQFLEMGDLVRAAVSGSVASFIRHDVEKAKEVIKNDLRINSAEVAIESDCFKLIALQQPVAGDLRKIVAIMRATSDLERIGDHAVSMAEATIHVKGNKRIIEIEAQLNEMAEIVESMLKRVQKAYVKLDVEEARKIAQADEAVDIYLKKVSVAIENGIRQNPEAVVGGMEYLLVAGYLERIGDYITNICERIVYTATGKLTELN